MPDEGNYNEGSFAVPIAVMLALGVLGTVVCLAVMFFRRLHGSRVPEDAVKPLLKDDNLANSSQEMTAINPAETPTKSCDEALDDAIPTARADMVFLRTSPAPTFITDTKLNIVQWSIGMVEACAGIDPGPGSSVAALPFASQDARDRMLEFLRDHTSSTQITSSAMSTEMRVFTELARDEEDGGDGGASPRCYMHMRPTGGLCDDVLLSMTLVTKTELGDLVLVGKEMDPKLAGLIGSAASGNGDTISELTSIGVEEGLR